MPTAFAAIGSIAPPEKMGKMMGVLGSMGALTMIIGPIIGGFMVEHFGWRTVFYINIPIGVLAILLAFAFKESYGSASSHIDVFGSALISFGLGFLLLGVNQLGSHPLTDITVFPLLLIALLLGLTLYWYERRTPEPILDMALLFRRDILSINLAFMMVFVGLMCTAGYTATFAQVVLGLGVQDSGTIMTPVIHHPVPNEHSRRRTPGQSRVPAHDICRWCDPGRRLCRYGYIRTQLVEPGR